MRQQVRNQGGREPKSQKLPACTVVRAISSVKSAEALSGGDGKRGSTAGMETARENRRRSAYGARRSQVCP